MCVPHLCAPASRGCHPLCFMTFKSSNHDEALVLYALRHATFELAFGLDGVTQQFSTRVCAGNLLGTCTRSPSIVRQRLWWGGVLFWSSLWLCTCCTQSWLKAKMVTKTSTCRGVTGAKFQPASKSSSLKRLLWFMVATGFSGAVACRCGMQAALCY